MTVDDAYAELGLPRGADLTQAKAAWRTLVSRWHPDRNDHAGASARMQRINRALEQIRLATQGQTGPRPAGADTTQTAVRTARHHVKLTLEETAAGCIRTLQGTIIDTCTACAGQGHAHEPTACASCAGKGRIQERSWFGWYGVARSCADCNGTGTVQTACVACNGRGKTEVLRYRQSVRLPAQVRHGDVLHVPAGRARMAVALDIHVEVLPHACLVRDDDEGTVRCECAVDAFGWIANRTIDVPTLRGNGVRSCLLPPTERGRAYPFAGGQKAGPDPIAVIQPSHSWQDCVACPHPSPGRRRCDTPAVAAAPRAAAATTLRSAPACGSR